MSEELKYLLSEIKDNSQDYIGTNGCRYQDLLREELDLLVDEIERLNNIINELEKVLQSNMAYYDNLYEEQDEQEYIDKYFALKEVFDKLQELKGENNV